MLGHRAQALADHRPQGFRIHARQRAQVELQAALAADSVGVVATVDAAEVQRGLRHAELRIAELLLPLATQLDEVAHHRVHGLQGAVAQAGVGGVAALPEDVDALHHHPLVQADGLEPRRLADHCRTAQGPAGLHQGASAGHGAFLVTGGEDDQRLLEALVQQAAHRLDSQGEEALHVAAAQAVPAIAGFAEFQRVGFPQGGVEGHGVAMAGQHQASGARAVGRQQVGLARRDLLDLAAETEVAEPGSQQFDHRLVRLVPTGLGAAHRRSSDQRSELGFQVRNGHREASTDERSS
ncbi:hypothetical protein D9M69_468000 [compost metagenome]